jgi:DnaK suppressor protein
VKPQPKAAVKAQKKTVKSAAVKKPAKPAPRAAAKVTKVAKPTAKASAKPLPKGAKPSKAVKPPKVAKPAAKPASKAVSKSGRAVAKSPAKPAAKPVPKAAPKLAKAAAKPAAKPAAKVAPKSAGKPGVKTASKASVKATPKKTLAKPAAKPAAKTAAKTAARTPVQKPAAQKPAARKTPATPPATPPSKAGASGAARSAPVAAARATASAATAASAAAASPASHPSAGPATPAGLPPRATKPSARLAQITVPSMAQSVASTAAKASYFPTVSLPVTSPAYVAVKKDPKLANNWKAKPADQLSDAEVLAMPDAEYMNDKQLAFFRLKLMQLKQDILNSAGETTEHLREDTVIVPDPADRATIEEEHALELRTRDRERKLLKKIEQSIARIDAGDYGYCDETGEPIGVGRLLARPTATLSLEAQQRRELKQKMFGD